MTKTFGEAVKQARVDKGLSQEALGHLVGISQPAIRKIENGADSKHKIKIAAVLGLTHLLSAELAEFVHPHIDQLSDQPGKTYNKQLFNVEPGPAPRGRYPLITWAQAGEWEKIVGGFDGSLAQAFYLCPKECSAQSFLLKVRGRSMEPKYQDGDLLFVDPEAAYQHGSNVIVKVPGSQEPVFKHLVIEGGQCWIEPLNPDWPEKAVQMSVESRIIGIVIGKWVPD